MSTGSHFSMTPLFGLGVFPVKFVEVLQLAFAQFCAALVPVVKIHQISVQAEAEVICKSYLSVTIKEDETVCSEPCR